jgi:hypothetical protein
VAEPIARFISWNEFAVASPRVYITTGSIGENMMFVKAFLIARLLSRDALVVAKPNIT